MKSYQAGEIEKKWQKKWEKNETFKVSNDSNKPKFYVLDMFPYPSGSGLHVGHPLGYIASDIMARYKKQEGYNVLHPMGYDAFGLPAEQYAISKGIHPAESTEKNIKRYRSQLKEIGLSYDWSRELRTSDPKFYKWTQYIFILLFNYWYDKNRESARPISELREIFKKEGNQRFSSRSDISITAEEWEEMDDKKKSDILMDFRLAYRKESYVNWCEELGTVLANDEVVNGVSERGGYPVVKRPMMQWSLRITAYADRLLDSLDDLEWSNSLKQQQRNWINRSEGVALSFDVAESDKSIEVFTTRPDTIFGATFMVLAPEHEAVDSITTSKYREKVDSYKDYVAGLSDIERMQEKKVTGQFTGAYCIHPITEEKIPVYIAEYILSDYGTGAIMAVPDEDERDKKFAKEFNIPIHNIIDRSDYPDSEIGDKVGIIVNSDFLNGLEVAEAINKMIDYVEENEFGYAKVNYKLRDANFSRQRYWGEPFPILYDKETGIPITLSKDKLPLELPDMDLDSVQGEEGKAPLSSNDEWVNEVDGYKREVDTMPGFAGSSWYFLRYMDPDNEDEMFSEEAVEYWKDVDLYVGGTEHAVGHLMYARFWHKFLYDTGYVPTEEPFKKLVNQGMISGRSLYLQIDNDNTGKRRIHIPIDLADEDDYLTLDKFKQLQSEDKRFENIDIESEIKWEEVDGQRAVKLIPEVEKMSKSKFNVVNPEDVIEEYGTDCFRLYEMFLGPIEDHKPWDTQGMSGVYKFLNKLWLMFYDHNGEWLPEDKEPTDEQLKVLHQCIKKVKNDIEEMSYNTCVSAFMEAVNDLRKLDTTAQSLLEDFLKLLAPFAPHLCEELWEKCGHDESISTVPFPEFVKEYAAEDAFTYPLCINGKKRAEVEFPAGMSKEEIESEALKNDKIQKWIEGKEVKRTIIVPKRMVNIVV